MMPRPTRALSILAGAAFAVGALVQSVQAQQLERADFQVSSAREGWADTPAFLADGDRTTVRVAGTARYDAERDAAGPNGAPVELCVPMVAELPIGALAVRVGNGTPVLAERATLAGPGIVQVAYNDCVGQFFDNTGSFTVTFETTRVAPPAATVTPAAPTESAPPAPVEQLSSTARDGGVPRWLILVSLLPVLVIGAWFALRVISRPRPRFKASARLESSAWVAPVWLSDLQSGRFPKRALTVGGPDADIDFGVPGVRARLVPTRDGGTRIEKVGDGHFRILVNDVPLVLGLGQRLANGDRVTLGQREFVFHEERGVMADPSAGRGKTPLGKRDPRVAA